MNSHRVHPTVRPALKGDVAQIGHLAVTNAMFATEDMAGFDDMLTGYIDGSLHQHQWIVAEDSAGGISGAAYVAPEPFGDRVWNLYFLAVNPARHRAGIGHALVAYIEESLRRAGEEVARVLIV